MLWVKNFTQLHLKISKFLGNPKSSSIASMLLVSYYLIKDKKIDLEISRWGTLVVLRQFIWGFKNLIFNLGPVPAAVPSDRDSSEDEISTVEEKSTSESDTAESGTSKKKGGVAAVVIIVLIIIVVIALVMYKKMRTDYDGGFTFKGIFR